MARPTKIDKLPKRIKALITKLREEGASIDEIMTAMREELTVLGLAEDRMPSRATVGRHTQEYDAFIAMMREVRGVNDTLAAELGDGDDDRVRRANLEALDIFVSKVISKMARGEMPDIKDIKSLSEIQKNIGIAARTSLDVEIRKKREWEAEQKKKLEELAAAERADGNVLAAEFAQRAMRHLGL